MENGYQFFVQRASKQYPDGDQVKFLSWQVCVHFYTIMYMYTCMHTNMHAHTLSVLTHTHTHTHTYTQYAHIIHNTLAHIKLMYLCTPCTYK